MYGNICGDAIPRYLATAGGKIPLHKDNVVQANEGSDYMLKKPWSDEIVPYPDMSMERYRESYGFENYAFDNTQHTTKSLS
jgi:lysine 2,3-aminomutase